MTIPPRGGTWAFVGEASSLDPRGEDAAHTE